MLDIDKFFLILINIGNVLSVVYNIPQMWHTWKTKRAGDISSYFLWMRLASSVIWCSYSFHYKLWDVSISWIMSLISSIMILYYKYYPGLPRMIELA
jgi:uncharacterized protein with PQ loop repeat